MPEEGKDWSLVGFGPSRGADCLRSELEDREEQGSMGVSNLERFLSRATPAIQSRFLPKNSNADEKVTTKNELEYFNLGDLWDCFDEWSAYGLGSPIVVSNQERVVQYYVPYLSAIQIYIAKSEVSRGFASSYESEFETKSWSSNDESKLSRSSSSISDKSWDVEDLGVGFENCWSGSDQLGELLFEHFESDGPFGRVPLKNKVDALSCKHWSLRTLNSIDLSPSSWVAIAWYPIYHIPASRNAKKLHASFLMYHGLSSFQESMWDETPKTSEEETNVGGKIHLHPFGLATYRMQPRIWLDQEGSGHERISSLMAAANSWMKQLQVRHHDYNFFISHPT